MVSSDQLQKVSNIFINNVNKVSFVNFTRAKLLQNSDAYKLYLQRHSLYFIKWNENKYFVWRKFTEL